MQFPTDLLRTCWFLAGPTACGKSDGGLRLAERIGGEIVSLDSMAIYRGMDIGTAKPADRRTVPHHLLDIIDPHEEFSVAEYVEAAEASCREIVDRGRVPLFVGGTGLYLRSVLRGVFDGPPADWEFRRRLQADAAAEPPDSLHHRLAEVDSQSAAQLHPRDTRRIIRALEVHHITGRPLSEQQQQDPLPPEQRPQHVYWLSPPRDWLYDRINRRVEQMFEAGLIEEVRRLLDGPKPLSHTARQALGYREIIDAIEAGRDPSTAVDLIQRRTRQFAKRQHTWFRNLEECRAVEMTGEESPETLVARLVSIPRAIG